MGLFKDAKGLNKTHAGEGIIPFGVFTSVPLISHSRLTEDGDKMRGRPKKKKLDPDTLYQVKYRTELERCELLGHLAYDAGHNSVQRIIEERLFKRTWRQELNEARERHRKAGLKEHYFYPNSVKKILGLKWKAGRKTLKKNLPYRAA